MYEYAKVALKEIQLNTLNLLLSLSMLMSSEKLLISTRLDIAKMLKNNFIFAISLLGATIQDSGMKERSDIACLLYR